jgi:hypothetical protein
MNRTCPFDATRSRTHFRSFRLWLALLALLVSPLTAVSQSGPQAPNRLTIGVALEGGSALGLAHIGVLRWFEHHHIPLTMSPEPAWVAGTSSSATVSERVILGSIEERAP